jgi:hypothetical protein
MRNALQNILSIAAGVCLTTACGNTAPVTTATAQVPASTAPVSTQGAIPSVTAAPEGIWEKLLLATPYPHEFPLPAGSSSPLDGTFAKIDPSPPQWWTCYRCADYRPTGGIWRIQFDKGVMRIYYEVTDWKSIASFTVDRNRLRIFNDPFCPQDVGEYEWNIEDGLLSLAAVEDGCAFDLRRKNLVKQTWAVCSVDQHAEGCTEPPHSPPGTLPDEVNVTVNVLGGDSHYFEQKPEIFTAANPEDVAPPEGIVVNFDTESIPYGTHRVLWHEGDWVEATTSLPYTFIGVQFWGSGYLGWARVLFDGEEVWRGLTTSIGKSLAYYGGYVEITGFEPGEHTIRVESLAFDYHPIKVAAFGFGNNPAVK